jgi:hypothetical protein
LISINKKISIFVIPQVAMPKKNDLDSLTVVELRKIAKKRGDIDRVNSLRKAQLISTLKKKKKNSDAPSVNEKIARALALKDYAKVIKALVGIKLVDLRAYPRRPKGVTAAQVKNARTRRDVIGLLLGGDNRPTTKKRKTAPKQRQVTKKPKDDEHNKILLIDILEQRSPEKRAAILAKVKPDALADLARELGVWRNIRNQFGFQSIIEAEIARRQKKNDASMEVPCPKVYQNLIGRQKYLSAEQLGIYDAVRDCIYPYPQGSTKDKEFLSRPTYFLSNSDHILHYNVLLLERILAAPNVRDVCLVDPKHHEILSIGTRVPAIDEKEDFEDVLRRLMKDTAEVIELTPPRAVSIQALADQEMLHIIPPQAVFERTGAKGVAMLGHERFERARQWLTKGNGPAVHCDKTTKPWLPVLINSVFGTWGHATVLLLNRSTGVAYYFEPNGNCGTTDKARSSEEAYERYVDDVASPCTAIALASVPLTYNYLTRGGMPEEEWTKTRFVHLPGELGPQHLQEKRGSRVLDLFEGTCSVWSHLFIHLFLLHPELEPEELLKRMLASEQRPYLGTIISRYGMFLAELADRKN